MGKSNQKAGARHNRRDQTMLQTMHDYAKDLGAACDDEDEGEKSTDAETLVMFGDAVKALGNGKVGGYLVRFTKQGDYDLTGDRFDPDTDFGERESLPVFYQHGMDATMGKRVIGKATLRKDDVGVWTEAQLNLRDEYEKAIYALAEKGKLGYSSGVPQHLVERKSEGGGYVIKMWHLAEASLTPTPAEYRNSVMPLKTLIETFIDPEAKGAEDAPAKEDTRAVSSSNAVVKVHPVGMTETAADSAATIIIQAHGGGVPKDDLEVSEEIKTMLDAATKTIADTIGAQVSALGERLGKVETALEKEPAINATKAGVSTLEVISDPADVPFKNLADFCQAVKAHKVTYGQSEAPRLKYLKHLVEQDAMKAVTGASEAVPADGGFLLDPTLSAEFIKPIHEEGPFSSRVRTLPVSANSNSGWINGVDETSRVTGSRWGGIRGYRLAEGGTKTASRPTFRRINWELKKYAILVYGTDELLQDASQFSAVVNQGCREELNFMVNDDIFEGAGLAGPQGVMNTPSLITVTRDTGGTVLQADILALWNRLDARSKANSAWYIHNEVQPKLDALYFSGSTSVLSPYVGYRPDGAMTLYGRPVVVTEFNAALNTTGDILLADMGQYLFWEKGGVQEATSIHVAFLTDETTFRFVYRCDGQSSLSSALTPFHGSTTTSPFVVLGSAT